MVTASEISNDSLNPHYGDFLNLVDTALFTLCGCHVDESIDAMKQSFHSATTKVVFAANLRAVTRATQTPERDGWYDLIDQVIVKAFLNEAPTR